MACTFPSVEYTSTTDHPDTGPDTNATMADATSDADLVVEASTRPQDAGPILDAAICATKPLCDCDNDGFLSSNCDAGADAKAMTGKPGGDCDDLDPFRKPSQTFTDQVPAEGGTYDWNCSGAVDKAYPENPACTGLLGVIPCAGEGFQKAVGCGATADYYKCQSNGVGCVLTAFDGTKEQLCK